MSIPGPRLIGYNMGYDAYEYLEHLLEHGLVVGPLGRMEINAKVRPLVDAMHHVLAGGTVKVEVTTPGNPQVVAELADAAKKAGEESNAINKAMGFYVTAIP